MNKNWKGRLAVAAALAATASTALTSPAYAAPMTPVAWSISKPNPSAASVRYTWSFTTPTGGAISKVTFTVPDGTTDAGLSIADASGLSGGTATLDTTGNPDVVTYTPGAGPALAANTSVLVVIDGFTNVATPGSYTSTATTYIGAVATDAGTSAALNINDNNTVVNVKVAQSTAFSSDTTAFTMLMDPAVASLKDQTKAVTLTVATNAAHGYTLNTKVNQLLTGSLNAASTFAAASNGKSTGVATGSFAPGTFGYKMTSSRATLQSAPLIAGDYVGYKTGAGDDVLVTAAPSNGDTVVLTNRASIDYTQPADTYTGTVTYTVTPSY